MHVISPQFTMEQAQFVVNVLNEVPLPGIPAKQAALGIQVALQQAVPYELDEEPEAPAEEPDVVE